MKRFILFILALTLLCGGVVEAAPATYEVTVNGSGGFDFVIPAENNFAGFTAGNIVKVTGPTSMPATNINAWAELRALTVAFALELNDATTDIPNFALSVSSGASYVGAPITSLTAPKVAMVGYAAFTNCDNLTTVNLPVAETFQDIAFAVCDSLVTVDLPKAETIGESAFEGCSILTSVSLPSAQTIGQFAFTACASLTDIFSYGNSLTSVAANALDNLIGPITIHTDQDNNPNNFTKWQNAAGPTLQELRHVGGVTLNWNTLSLTVGYTRSLTATVTPNSAVNQVMNWTTDNASVATVNTSGLVTAIGVGSCTITVTTDDRAFADTCTVTVTAVNPGGNPVTGVTLNHKTMSLTIGETGTLSPDITPANATNKNVTWKSSNDKIATVNANGKVTAIGVGTCEITVTTVDGNKADTCKLTVTAPGTGPVAPPADQSPEITINLTGLDLGPDGVKHMKPGDEIKVTLTTNPAGASFSWTGNPAELALAASGYLSGIAKTPGTYTVTITATLNGKTVTATFTIKIANPNSGSGGCDSGVGMLGLAVLTLLGLRKR